MQRCVHHGSASAAAVDLREHGRGVHVRREREEAVAWVVRLPARHRVWVGTRDLDAEGVPAHEIADLLGVLFVHPGFEFTPPKG